MSERPIGDKYLTGNKGASLEAPSVIKDGLRGIAKTPESLYVSCTRNEPARWKSFHFFYPKVQYNKNFLNTKIFLRFLLKFIERYGTLIVENTERNSMIMPAIGEFLQAQVS